MVSNPTAEPYQHPHIWSSLLRRQWVPEQATQQSSSLDVRQRHTNIIYQAGRLWTRSFRLTWSSGYSSFATRRGYYWFLYTYRAVTTFRWTVCHDQAPLLSNRISVIHGSRINYETICCPQFCTYSYQILCHVGGTSPPTWYKIW